MEKKPIALKEKIFAIIGVVIILIAVGAFIYEKFFYELEPDIPMSAQEQKELEQKLIDRYGSVDNIPTNERDCVDYGDGTGCW